MTVCFNLMFYCRWSKSNQKQGCKPNQNKKTRMHWTADDLWHLWWRPHCNAFFPILLATSSSWSWCSWRWWWWRLSSNIYIDYEAEKLNTDNAWVNLVGTLSVYPTAMTLYQCGPHAQFDNIAFGTTCLPLYHHHPKVWNISVSRQFNFEKLTNHYWRWNQVHRSSDEACWRIIFVFDQFQSERKIWSIPILQRKRENLVRFLCDSANWNLNRNPERWQKLHWVQFLKSELKNMIKYKR